MKCLSLFLLLSLTGSGVARAISVGEAAEDNSVEAQLAAFEVHEEFDVDLFADESLGIANPVAMHWDHLGRLWVLTTLTYAQLEPGQEPDDTLVILEDTDGDGRADRSTVFADGLNMPMGFALGHGGVFVGEEADLLFLKDTTGDGLADTREVLLTGFGHGDTHQNISNFTWGPDGHLYFSQGLHAYSLVETPWGIVRGDAAGFWRLHPETLRLEPFCFPSLASQNPCGIAFDRSGAMFLKSNSRELIYVTPGLVPTTRQKNLLPVASLGDTPGKSMGGEYVDSSHLPEWLQHHVLIAGYYSHRVTAFPLVEEGAGYARVEPVELLSSSHSSFRPVEIRVGPDGAIYVADWFNPIIGHYQASLRHPDRDEEHGRIWRITAKGRALSDPAEWSLPETVPTRDYLTVPRGQIEEKISSASARDRLDAVVAAANLDEAEALPLALRVLDLPRDRFLDYALEQTVHALASRWVPALEAGELSFESPDHLAYALGTLGGERGLELAIARMQDPGLSTEARTKLAVVIASAGTPEDLKGLLDTHGDNAAVLRAMAESWEQRRVRPGEGFLPALQGRVASSENPEARALAVRLAGLWEVRPLGPEVRELAADISADAAVRQEAVRALARIEGEKSLEWLGELFEDADPALRAALAEALVSLDPVSAASVVRPALGQVTDADEASPLLAAFLSREGASAELAKAISSNPLSPAAASHLANAMTGMARSDESLLSVLRDAMGMATGGRNYSAEFVEKLVTEVSSHGNAAAGEEIYQRAQLACVACHQIDEVGGIIGPPLDAVGAGLTPDLLVESVLWPQRQLKEGYIAVAVTTKGGATYSGYLEKEEDGLIHLRDTASGQVQTIPRREVAKLDNVGSLMPEGLTNSLSEGELRDLIAYLAALKG